ncbi:MAG: hypothetical protein KKH93_05555 [Candidatus Omnitrophica bacterium]|nr:hypothetical protein [Candidatus Omnitrophota bacterium]MBU2044166.1 hypothetical protein [Candidatus Omnitrophota bacterium]MBU2251444.1 hypothetical protein [Candidatus Omnitrophota bacterium]
MRKIEFFLIVLLVFSAFPVFSQGVENITVTTYYPAPYGVYKELKTTGNTSLAVSPNSQLGVGTESPSVGGEQDLKLDVEGAIGAQHYCDASGNNCVEAPVGRFGGMFMRSLLFPFPGACIEPNPLYNGTAWDRCHCPDGYTEELWNTSVLTVSVPPLIGSSLSACSYAYVYYCYK